jgi:hypothetical protein
MFNLNLGASRCETPIEFTLTRVSCCVTFLRCSNGYEYANQTLFLRSRSE